MALVDANSFTTSINDNLVPVNESFKNLKNLDNDQYVNTGCGLMENNINNVKAVNSGEMEINSCKGSEMDVESVNKDDAMDVDLVDHMDIDDNGRKGEEEDFVNDDLDRVLGLHEGKEKEDQISDEKSVSEEKDDSCNLEKTEEPLSNGNVENVLESNDLAFAQAAESLEELLKPESEKPGNESEEFVKEAIEKLITGKDPLSNVHHEFDSSQKISDSTEKSDADLLSNNSSVPENLEKLTGSDEISSEVNKEVVSDNLIDDLINFNDSSVLEKESENDNITHQEEVNNVDGEKTVVEDQDSYNKSTDESLDEDDVPKVPEGDKEGEDSEAMDVDVDDVQKSVPSEESGKVDVNSANPDDKNEEPEDVDRLIPAPQNSANEQNDKVDQNVNASDTNEVHEDIDTLVSELDQLFDENITSTSDDAGKIDESSKETEEVPFGIIGATSIAPTEFENMESVQDQPPSTVLKLSELAQNTLKKNGKKPINVKTIKEEKLDFNIKEELEDYDQITIQENVDIKPNVDSMGDKAVIKKKAKRRTCVFSYKKTKKKGKKKPPEDGKIIDSVKKIKKVVGPATIQNSTILKKVTPSRSVKKTPLPVINLLDVKTSPNKNLAVKRTRSLLPVTKDVTPSGKKPRLSLPNVKSTRPTRSKDKRLLRSAGEIAEKIQNLVNEPSTSKVTKIPKSKPSQVAKKSTTTVGKLPTKIRNVAVKRGKPYQRPEEPEPIFVDTNFGAQDIDMFINENDDDDSCYSVPQTSYSKSRSPRKRIRPCEVVIKRMPVIDRLLPAKKEPEKLEPNICELCDPKRIFLSKSSLADHIKEEHLRHSTDTSVIPPTPPKTDIKSCKFCKKTFHSNNRLTEHMKSCSKEFPKQYLNKIPGIDLSNLNKSVTISYAKKGDAPAANHACNICNRKFLMATGLKSHMRTHKTTTTTTSPSKPKKPGKSNLICNICDKSFGFCSDLVEHMTFHSLPTEKERDILSSNLNKISNIEINLENYVGSDDEESSVVSSDDSDYGYEVTIMKPLVKTDFAPNKCYECSRVFTIKAVYDRHVGLISKTNNIKDRRCPICDVEIKTRCKLGAHLETHKPQPEEQLICKKCNKTFRCENNLIRHELEHEGKLKVNCQYCSLSFNSMSDLYDHQSDCKFKCSEYKCNLCKRVFTAKWRLDLHMKTDEKHGTDPQQPNTYFCDQCGREFKHLSVLKRHIDSRCGTEPLYECPDCDKKYFSQGSLASHKRTQHSTEKNFMCQYCSKDFFTKHQLHRHELRHNPDVRPYRCKYPNCDKTYRQPDSLRAHECEHTGLYPYACEFCGVQFSNVKSLKLHRKSSNHWSDVEPNKVVTQACRQKHLGRKEEKKKEEDEEEIDPEGHEDEPKNLVINEGQFEGVYQGERLSVPQYSTLQPFTVNHLMHHNQGSSVLVQAAHPLASYTQAIENYFVIASQQEPMAGGHHHPMMN